MCPFFVGLYRSKDLLFIAFLLYLEASYVIKNVGKRMCMCHAFYLDVFLYFQAALWLCQRLPKAHVHYLLIAWRSPVARNSISLWLNERSLHRLE